MSKHQIAVLTPAKCSEEQLQAFYDLVIYGAQVLPEGLTDRIASATLLAFAYVDTQLAGVAAVKNQKRNYVTGIFLKAKVPRLAKNYRYEIGYAVTQESFRRRGISRDLIGELMAATSASNFYATTKNDGMRVLLEKTGFERTGNCYMNADGETLDLYTSNHPSIK